jgi:DNA-binding XRE family transcriptional regulator
MVQFRVMNMAHDPGMPDHLVHRYLAGETTVMGMAAELGVAGETVSQRLQARGVATTKGAYQRRRLGRRIELTNHLRSGTAVQAMADLYCRRLSCRAIAGRLGLEWQAARRLLHHEEVPVRPNWWREVFHGRREARERFAARLLELRASRGWSQRALGLRCRLDHATIGRMERGRAGPSWDTLHRLGVAFGLGLEAFGVTWSPP